MNFLKRFLLFLCLFGLLAGALAVCAPIKANASMSAELLHEKLIYPVIRVNGGGSGTIIYSKPNANGTFSTYALTNYHVIAPAISIVN